MTKTDPLERYSIREATEEDLPAILDIYNEQVLNSTALFLYDPIPLQDRQSWFSDSKQLGYPVIVAVEKSTEQTIAYCSLGVFRSKPAYCLSAEISLYIHKSHHRQGLGKVLLSEMIRIAQEMRLRSIIASVTADNAASLGLFGKHKFVLAGKFHDVGYKFGCFLDVEFHELILDAAPKVNAQGVPEYNPFPWGRYTYGGSAL
ncbi:acyl-CoA N-acyltransferase [Radiomyces spectabilis]|uniref:acyl-CoA N-acyltransferase n=1 Tax=Radiomyces spectabilis TaxID=64574 RepID=UPI00221FCFA5|nr:acyl-CoA N-acyltransferase [Radiomyces spectabilis]KAI8379056.1 acyl-CoA N-acyltransferase [Radiomyces spectabilis]